MTILRAQWDGVRGRFLFSSILLYSSNKERERESTLRRSLRQKGIRFKTLSCLAPFYWTRMFPVSASKWNTRILFRSAPFPSLPLSWPYSKIRHLYSNFEGWCNRWQRCDEVCEGSTSRSISRKCAIFFWHAYCTRKSNTCVRILKAMFHLRSEVGFLHDPRTVLWKIFFYHFVYIPNLCCQLLHVLRGLSALWIGVVPWLHCAYSGCIQRSHCCCETSHRIWRWHWSNVQCKSEKGTHIWLVEKLQVCGEDVFFSSGCPFTCSAGATRLRVSVPFSRTISYFRGAPTEASQRRLSRFTSSLLHVVLLNLLVELGVLSVLQNMGARAFRKIS